MKTYQNTSLNATARRGPARGAGTGGAGSDPGFGNAGAPKTYSARFTRCGGRSQPRLYPNFTEFIERSSGEMAVPLGLAASPELTEEINVKE